MTPRSTIGVHSIANHSLRRSVVLAGIACMVGCISVPEKDAPQCRTVADCEQTAGEVCEEGVCWGDPPQGALAAIIGPPGDANDLVPAELPEFSIPDHGYMPELVLGTPVTIRGQVLRECVLPCQTETPVESIISVTRASSFAGGPGLTLIEKTKSDGTFTLNLPLTRLGQSGRANDPPYAVTISPADRGPFRSTLSSVSAEELPPMRVPLIATKDTAITFRLPGSNLATVEGRLLDSAGASLPGYRIVARGRWQAAESISEVSTVAVTGIDGSYRLQLAENLVEKVAIRAEPPATQPSAGTLEVSDIDPQASATGVDFRLPLNERAAVTLSIPVEASDSGGQVTPVDGIAVRLHYEIESGASSQVVRYEVEGTTKGGRVTLVVVPGVLGTDWTYRLRMLPPADSRLAAVFDRPLVVGAGGEQPTMRLAERVRISGVLYDQYGALMKGVSLTARPSRSFLQQLDSAKRTFVNEIAATTASTSKTGEFVVWADPSFAAVPARYSLTFQPPEGQFQPTWTDATEIMIPSDDGIRNVDAGEIRSPEASHVHGLITNPGGRPVANGQLLIYRLDGNCAAEAAGCNSTAQLIGRGVADDDGIVRITLPKSP
jgi:hypothetical protein